MILAKWFFMKRINPKSQKEWRAWLEKYHDKETAVELIHYKKHTGKRAMSAQEAMDEAICFGWIDTTVKRLDDDTFLQKFRKRNSKGKWSKNTFSYAKRLIKDGKMTEVGLKAYKQGLKNPLADGGILDNPKPPEEFLEALKNNKVAEEFFNNLSPSLKKMHMRWLARAKMQETKDKRITKLVESFSERKKVW